MTSNSAQTLARIAALALSGALFSASALANNPSPQEFATARELYKQGKDLRASGDLHGAYEKLKAANALAHTPLTGVELARTEVALNMLVEARETCLAIARMPVESDETERSAEARTDAAKLAEELRPRLATIRLHVKSATPAIVTVDGENVPTVAIDEPRLVNPGHHVVVAHVDGGTDATSAIDVGEGASQDVALEPPPAPIAMTNDRAQDHDRDHPTTSSHGGLGALTLAGIAITGAGLVAGTIGGVIAMSANVNPSVCPNYQCPQAVWDTLNGARSAALASTIGFAFAGGGVVLFVVGLLTHTSSQSSLRGVRVIPDLAFDHVGVSGVF